MLETQKDLFLKLWILKNKNNNSNNSHIVAERRLILLDEDADSEDKDGLPEQFIVRGDYDEE